MNVIKSLFLSILFLMFLSCSSTKNKGISNEIERTETIVKNESIANDGYTKGTIVFSNKPDDCAYTIQIDGQDNLMYDPTNLDAEYQNHNEKVWFTFSPLRRMNRCEKANPIYLTDIKKQL